MSLCLEAFTGGSQKAALIRQIKTWLAVGLKEAKDTVESAPCVLKSSTFFLLRFRERAWPSVAKT